MVQQDDAYHPDDHHHLDRQAYSINHGDNDDKKSSLTTRLPGHHHHQHQQPHQKPTEELPEATVRSPLLWNHHSAHQRPPSSHHHHHMHQQEQQQHVPSIFERGHTWMRPDGAYTYNGTPLSWFQRYNYYYHHHYHDSRRMPASGAHAVPPPSWYRPYRDENYATSSAGSLPDVEWNDDDTLPTEPSWLCPPVHRHSCYESCCQAICRGLLCCAWCRRRRKKKKQTLEQQDPQQVPFASSSSSPPNNDTSITSTAVERRHLGGNRSGSSNNNTISANNSNNNSLARYKASSGFCFVLLLWTIGLPMVVWLWPHNTTTWQLYAGESHVIPSPAAWFIHPRAITITTSTTMTNKQPQQQRSAQVYAIPTVEGTNRCPAPTGPILDVRIGNNDDNDTNPTIHKDLLSVVDTKDDDYFYLNQGSTLEARVTATAGSARVDLVQGEAHAPQKIMVPKPLLFHQSGNHPTHINQQQHLLQTQFVTATSNTTTATTGQVILNYTVDTTDTYILVYDRANDVNGSTSSGSTTTRLQVSYHLRLTTYNLSQYEPICDDATMDHPCTVSLPFAPPLFFFLPHKQQQKHQCLVVQASPNDSEVATGANSEDNVVTVQIVQHCQYGWLVLIVLLPLFIYMCSPCCHDDGDDDNGYTPFASWGLRAYYEEVHDAVPPLVSPLSCPPAWISSYPIPDDNSHTSNNNPHVSPKFPIKPIHHQQQVSFPKSPPSLLTQSYYLESSALPKEIHKYLPVHNPTHTIIPKWSQSPFHPHPSPPAAAYVK